MRAILQPLLGIFKKVSHRIRNSINDVLYLFVSVGFLVLHVTDSITSSATKYYVIGVPISVGIVMLIVFNYMMMVVDSISNLVGLFWGSCGGKEGEKNKEKDNNSNEEDSILDNESGGQSPLKNRRRTMTPKFRNGVMGRMGHMRNQRRTTFNRPNRLRVTRSPLGIGTRKKIAPHGKRIVTKKRTRLMMDLMA